MLKGLVKHRPRQLVAVYIESRQLEVLRAHRQWRTWQIETTEQVPLSEGESVFEALQHLNLRPRGKRGTALVLFLPRSFYSFHREYYPLSLQEQLQDALNYDWQENLFHEHEQTLHFAGPSVVVEEHLSVPIFSLQQEVHDKFQQAVGGGAFQTFTMIPSALAYGSLFTSVLAQEQTLPVEILGRMIDPNSLEINRFYHGALLDSSIIGLNQDSLKLFRENLLCLEDGVCQEKAHIHLICSDGECSQGYANQWHEENLPLYLHSLGGSLLTHWVQYLLGQDAVQTFDTDLLLKPWRVPKVVWPVLAMMGLYALLAFYQVHASHQAEDESRRLAKQAAQLETQWKPIEQLQTRIAKFQEDQKTLSQFNQQGYPLLEILTLLTRVTPDDTWLNYLSLRTGQLLLRGESKSAIKYLSDLSKVEGFTDVRFASPVTRNPGNNLERFNLQTQIDSEKLNKAIESLKIEEDEGAAEEGPDQGKSSLIQGEEDSESDDTAIEDGEDDSGDDSVDETEDASGDEAGDEGSEDAQP